APSTSPPPSLSLHQPPPPHPPTHSFPTRRSSDLPVVTLALHDERLGPQDLLGRAEGDRQPQDLALDGMLEPAVEGEVLGLSVPLDRKSTRLNSSHVAISYAVFCLKKKKKISLRI